MQMDVRSSIKKSKYILNWTVEDFREWPYGMLLRSNNYTPIPGQTFYSIFQKFARDKPFWHLSFNQLSGPKVEGKVSVNVLDCAGNKLSTLSKDCIFSKQEVTPGFGDYCYKILELLDASIDNSITFECVLEFKDYTTECWPVPNPNPMSDTHNLSTLSRDFKTMYATSLYADVALNLDNCDIPVHKSVLCARSPVFTKMFESPMDENNKNIVVIADVELPVLKDFVEFLYTGVLVRRDFESVYSLYAVADKYDVSSLRKTCHNILVSKMDASNACRILVLADRHSDVEFKKVVMEYVVLNYDRILKSQVWDEFVFENVQLAKEVRGRKQCKMASELKSVQAKKTFKTY